MITLRRIAALVLTLAALILASQTNAHAVADDATPRPEVLWPLPKMNPNAPTGIALQGHHMWNLRHFTNEADRQLSGIRIFNKGGCDAHPYATCVHFKRKDLGDNGVLAWTVFGDGTRDITINTHYAKPSAADRYAIVVHEFGHVLGMQHHKMLGIDGRTGGVVHLSGPELKILRKIYR